MIGPSCSILIIEDEKNILDFMTKALKANNYKLSTLAMKSEGSGICEATLDGQHAVDVV